MAQAITVTKMLHDLRAISRERADMQKELAALAADRTPEGKQRQRQLLLKITNCNGRIQTLERHVRTFHQQHDIAAHADRWSV
jgi:hypothetical protein